MNTLVKKCSLMVFSLFLTSCFASQFSIPLMKQEIMRSEDAEMIRFVKPFQFMCTFYKATGVTLCVQNVAGTWVGISADKLNDLAAEFASGS